MGSAIDAILASFPFDEVAEHMAKARWYWGEPRKGSIPGVGMLTDEARRLLRAVVSENKSNIHCGGFVVSQHGGVLRLSFRGKGTRKQKGPEWTVASDLPAANPSELGQGGKESDGG